MSDHPPPRRHGSAALAETDLEAAWTAARERLCRWGGAELVREMASLFLADTPARITTARAAAASGEWPRVASAIHALRGSCSQLGARRMQRICEDIELQAAGVLAPNVGDLFDLLDEEYAAFKPLLDAELAAGGEAP